MDRLNEFLRSEAATLALLFLALTAQAPHAAIVFHRVAPNIGDAPAMLAWLHAAGYAIALELATLVFVVRGQQRLAWTFAAVSVSVNLLYYWHPELTLAQALSATLISFALPVAIATYSHDVATQVHRGTPVAPATPPIADAIPDVAELPIAIPAQESVELQQVPEVAQGKRKWTQPEVDEALQRGEEAAALRAQGATYNQVWRAKSRIAELPSQPIITTNGANSATED